MLGARGQRLELRVLSVPRQSLGQIRAYGCDNSYLPRRRSATLPGTAKDLDESALTEAGPVECLIPVPRHHRQHIHLFRQERTKNVEVHLQSLNRHDNSFFLWHSNGLLFEDVPHRASLHFLQGRPPISAQLCSQNARIGRRIYILRFPG